MPAAGSGCSAPPCQLLRAAVLADLDAQTARVTRAALEASCAQTLDVCQVGFRSAHLVVHMLRRVGGWTFLVRVDDLERSAVPVSRALAVRVRDLLGLHAR